jgi:hypothetical protein
MKRSLALFMVLFLQVCTACQAQSTANETEVLQTQTQELITTSPALTEEPSQTEEGQPTPADTPIPQSTVVSDGPWLVYPAPDGSGIHAFDVEEEVILEILLPEPVFIGDLIAGLSPNGHTLVLRAGSPSNTDELALYQVDFPSGQVSKITPLLSLSNQRAFINGEDEQAVITFAAVTRTDGIAWSPDGHFLAFTAALDNNSSDLYVLNTITDHIARLNGLYAQSASPFWAPQSNWLVTQELGSSETETGWRSEFVEVVSIPDYSDQYTLYVPSSQSQDEIFLGWINVQSFLSTSQTAEGFKLLRQINVENISVGLRFKSSFREIAFDPESGCLALILDDEDALQLKLMAGVYLLKPDSATLHLQRAGDWHDLRWDPSGAFIASGSHGTFAFTPEEEGLVIRDEGSLQISPNGNWVIGYGDGENSNTGARLYQYPSGNMLQQITDQIVTSVYWLSDSKTIFIQSDGALYRLAFPELNLEQVEGGFSGEDPIDFIWVE